MRLKKLELEITLTGWTFFRLAIKNDPDEAIKLLSKVNKEDKNISKLFSKLSD